MKSLRVVLLKPSKYAADRAVERFHRRAALPAARELSSEDSEINQSAKLC